MTTQPIPLNAEGAAELLVVWPPLGQLSRHAMVEVKIPEPGPGQDPSFLQIDGEVGDRKLRAGLMVSARLRDGLELSSTASLDQLDVVVGVPEPEESAGSDEPGYRPLSPWE